MEKKVAVVAVGGNSLITDKTKTSMMDQMEAVKETCKHLADITETAHRLVLVFVAVNWLPRNCLWFLWKVLALKLRAISVI